MNDEQRPFSEQVLMLIQNKVEFKFMANQIGVC